jgi:Suppressor of fused protein (SUFU)
MAEDDELAIATRIDRYLTYLTDLTGGAEPRFRQINSTTPGERELVVITYLDLPEPGMLTVFTYGISLGDHPAWQAAKPELCLSVRSTDEVWGQAVGFLAEQLRGTCPFSYGDTLNLGEAVTQDSDMSAFVIFAPPVVAPADAQVDLGDPLPVNLVGIYPIHRSELQFIIDNDLKTFWEMDWDVYDVGRPPAV